MTTKRIKCTNEDETITEGKYHSGSYGLGFGISGILSIWQSPVPYSNTLKNPHLNGIVFISKHPCYDPIISPGNVVSGCEGGAAPRLPRALPLTDSRLPLLAPDAVDRVELKPAALGHVIMSPSHDRALPHLGLVTVHVHHNEPMVRPQSVQRVIEVIRGVISGPGPGCSHGLQKAILTLTMALRCQTDSPGTRSDRSHQAQTPPGPPLARPSPGGGPPPSSGCRTPSSRGRGRG